MCVCLSNPPSLFSGIAYHLLLTSTDREYFLSSSYDRKRTISLTPSNILNKKRKKYLHISRSTRFRRHRALHVCQTSSQCLKTGWKKREWTFVQQIHLREKVIWTNWLTCCLRKQHTPHIIVLYFSIYWNMRCLNCLTHHWLQMTFKLCVCTVHSLYQNQQYETHDFNVRGDANFVSPKRETHVNPMKERIVTL